MGSQLALRVVTLSMGERLKGASHATRYALMVMALTAHDGNDHTPRGLYFAGWDHLARAMGYGAGMSSPAGRKAVTRAMAWLTEHGLIERDETESAERYNVAYRLLF